VMITFLIFACLLLSYSTAQLTVEVWTNPTCVPLNTPNATLVYSSSNVACAYNSVTQQWFSLNCTNNKDVTVYLYSSTTDCSGTLTYKKSWNTKECGTPDKINSWWVTCGSCNIQASIVILLLGFLFTQLLYWAMIERRSILGCNVIVRWHRLNNFFSSCDSISWNKLNVEYKLHAVTIC